MVGEGVVARGELRANEEDMERDRESWREGSAEAVREMLGRGAEACRTTGRMSSI